MSDDLVKRLRWKAGAYAKEAADRIEELEDKLTWQPIETAPKDGTWVIGFFNEGQLVRQMKWGGREERLEPHWMIFGRWTPNISPTHWMPLPAPPSQN